MKNLRYIFKPNFWIMNHQYDKWTDKVMIDLLRDYDFEDIKTYTACLGGFEIWTSNYPYASMVFYGSNLRPSRKTIELAYKKLNKDKIELMRK